MKNPFSLDDRQVQNIVEKFELKKKLAQAKEKELFDVFEQPMSEEERFALTFLYAYMPLNDLADYDGELFLSHVRTSLDIRKKVPWGQKITDHLFLHFVLPYRVNNENIEDCRGWFFDQIFDRVKALSMEQAILEINHWCHEKATYIGNDPRTVSPLTLIRTTLGRCGEQSTLAVAALRSLGIPARQCYTPRWAHCDSNHAWVEAYADGTWYFLGACEPEARLNEGWFRAPALRAMLVNTRVPANYPGPEEATLSETWYTEINVLPTYAESKKVTIQVKDEQGDAVSGAKVQFQLYNSAEFTSIATITADEQGQASLTTGYGDLWIHAVSGNRWGVQKLRVADASEMEIIISEQQPEDGFLEFDMVPPVEQPDSANTGITDEEKQENTRRVQEGASIRASYEQTFVNQEQAEALAAELNLPPARVWEMLNRARGNSHEIAGYLKEFAPQFGEWALKLLESLNVKDLTDTFRNSLEDHLVHASAFASAHDDETFMRYILCPRINTEMIVPFRAFFLAQFTPVEQEQFRQKPAALAQWIADHVEILENYNYYQGSATPRGSFMLRKGDRLSIYILFVAMARSYGIPARLEPSERLPQFMEAGVWREVTSILVGEVEPVEEVHDENNGGFVKLIQADGTTMEYFLNFSIARFDHGVYKTLQYPYGKTDWNGEKLEVKSGFYRLVTGTRLSSGTVLIRMHMFTVEPGQTIEITPIFREETVELPVLGQVDPQLSLNFLSGAASTAASLAGDSGMLLAWIEPDREPSKHLIRELRELTAEFESWGGPISLVISERNRTAAFDPDAYADLPAKTQFAIDTQDAGLIRVTGDADAAQTQSLPLVFVIDQEGQIRYKSAGYKLGIGREALQVIKGVTASVVR
ncbi:transglutaminase domain-containing protein [Paenibacillus guangzhouensis]|uniref:transglutaminase domain-containing protein n=1 Tax=Paenibacillus guangzhouensis TaxID=1473112 RepID=UPI00126699F1|nr:transglutaminase domain-containing protein [Paenibacillus guangzhouensis]